MVARKSRKIIVDSMNDSITEHKIDNKSLGSFARKVFVPSKHLASFLKFSTHYGCLDCCKKLKHVVSIVHVKKSLSKNLVSLNKVMDICTRMVLTTMTLTPSKKS